MRKDRQPAESDKLGPYQFMPLDQVQVIEPTITLSRRLITLPGYIVEPHS